MKSLHDAIQALEDVKGFLDGRGCVAEATKTSSLIDDLALLKTYSAKQTSILTSFFVL